MDPLRRCPFCGSDAAIRTEAVSQRTYIFCQHRQCFVGHPGRGFLEESSARDAWNTRPDPFIRDRPPERADAYIVQVEFGYEAWVTAAYWDPINGWRGLQVVGWQELPEPFRLAM